MRILVVSDLHLEFPFSRYEPPNENYDVVVLAGDIHGRVSKAVEWAEWVFPARTPIVYVPGNHEYYGGAIGEHGATTLHGNSRVHVLDRGRLVIDDHVFIGATLWTDFRLGCATPSAARCAPMLACGCRNNETIAGQNVTDFRLISDSSATHGRFDTEAAAKRFALDRAFIEDELSSNLGKRCIVVTHHLPSAKSIAKKYSGSPINCAFASDVDDLIPRASLWIHGHTHDTFDYQLDGCRVVCNPAGYPRNGQRENPHFNARLIVDTSAM
jgi:predicted phosphodiesterase